MPAAVDRQKDPKMKLAQASPAPAFGPAQRREWQTEFT